MVLMAFRGGSGVLCDGLPSFLDIQNRATVVNVEALIPREAQDPFLAPHVQLASPADMLAEVRAALSLNVSETALVMHVERPTIYAWINGSTPREAHIKRLHELHGLARYWNGISNRPLGSLVRSAMVGMKTLVEHMADAAIDHRAVKALMDSLAVQLRRPEAHKRTAREIAMDLGLGASGDQGQERIDIETGKRMGSE